ncbi:MAG: anti-sigma F factor antagonist [Chitinophagales bacterium]
MHVTMNTVQDTLMVRIEGELDLAVADSLRDQIDSRLKHDRVQTLILDFDGVSFLDSSGLGVIIGRYKKMKNSGGQMCIIRTCPAVFRVLEFSGITKIIPVYETEKEVLRME